MGWGKALKQDRSCIALIAVKRRVQCKSRLARAMNVEQRLALVRQMLQQVIDACGRARSISAVVVLSPERDCVAESVAVLADRGTDLNSGLHHARAALHELGAREWLILPADLPTVTADEIDALVAVGRAGEGAIAGDERGQGTNGLFLPLAVPLRFQFGANSLAAHRAEAARLGLRLATTQLPGFAFDVDTVDDLFRLDARQWRQRA